ncbi:MAG: hypothetical protein IRZ00_17590 [Gemmatimonadetes bacterium]|nr:hypothetical protein [Gemmatimonadota bacterium]
MRVRTLGAAVALVLASGCAYFNSLYNAKRLFGEAERESARREGAGATSYRSAIEKARKSFRKDSTGRWSDEALTLVGRSFFALGQYDSARVTFAHVLARGRGGSTRSEAQAYLGATLVRLDSASAALAPLDSVVAKAGAGSEIGRFARLWRARARFATADSAGAWADLDVVQRRGGALGLDASVEALGRSIPGSPERADRALARIAKADVPDRTVDSLRTLSRAAAAAWGGVRARELLAPAERAPWPAARRGRLLLFRAQLAAEAGDTAAAVREALAVAGKADAVTVLAARLAAARWQLASATDVGGAAAARATLLAAVADPEAQRLLRGLKQLDVLVAKARDDGQPLSLFAAAELARDELGAPGLARKLFVTYAELVPQATWAPKALLAAAALAAPPERAALANRFESYAENVYVAAVHGGGADGQYTAAEERLAQALAALRADAAREAEARDAGVLQAVAVLDSVKAAARADSVKLACGSLVDSLALRGGRADSVRSACVRGDTSRVAFWLAQKDSVVADTASRAAPAGAMPPRAPMPGSGPGSTRRDTIR